MTRNRFGIPDDVIALIRERDKNCAYCGKEMIFPYQRANAIDSATIEHLHHKEPFYWKDGLLAEDIVITCGACNSSRGQKLLHEWFESAYCRERSINAETVSAEVRAYLTRKVGR